MSIAEANRLRELERRVAELEQKVAALLFELEQKRPTLSLKRKDA